jgi:hypothetical protein
MVVGVLPSRAVVAQGVVRLPVFGWYFVDYTFVKKALQDAVHGYAVYLFAGQPLHNVGVAQRTRLAVQNVYHHLLGFSISLLLLHCEYFF